MECLLVNVNYYSFSDIRRKVSVLVSSEHEALESSHLELQQSQQNVGSMETLEDVSHHGRKLQSEMSELKEESNGDNVKYKTVNGNLHRNNKGRGCVIESASVEKTLKREVKASKHLVSKGKCGMDQHDSTLSGERNDYVKCVQKYPGVRRTSSQYYTTIDEYFGKNYIKRDEKNHNSNDSTKNFGKLECTVSNHQQLACENKFPVESMKLEKSNQAIKTCTSSTKKKEKVAKLSAGQHSSKWWMNVTRRSSEPSELLSEIHKKRRFSYGGEESTVFGISADEESEMRLMRNHMKNRKEDEQMFESDTPELQKTGEQAHAYTGSTGSGTMMLPGGNETFKDRRKERTKQVKRSPCCPKVEQAATQGIHIQKVTKMKPGETVEAKNRKKEEKVLEKESHHCSEGEGQDGVQGASSERGTKVKGKNKENVLEDGGSHCIKRSGQASDGGVSIEESTKMTTGGCETLNSGANVENTKKRPQHFKTEEQESVQSLSTEKTKLKLEESERVMMGKNERILKENQRCSKTGQQATLQVISAEKTMIAKPRGNEIMDTEKNKMEILKESAHCLKTKEQAVVEDLALERKIEMKPEGSEMVICRKNKRNTLKEIPQILDIEEHTTVQDSPTKKATKIKTGVSEVVKTGKKEEKILKGSQNLKRGQQTAAQSISMDKATKMKSEILNDGRKKKKILKESPQELQIEGQDIVQSLSTEKTKLKSGKKEAKTGKNERILKESQRCLKIGQQATSQIMTTEEAMKVKPGGSEVVNTGTHKVKKILKESPQRLKPGEQAAAHVVSTEKMLNNTVSEVKSRENELLFKRSNADICRREKKYHSFESSNGCKRDKNDALLSEKQKRRNSLEGITNISKLDLKLDKYKKKREIMLELFGEDPDELSGSKSNSPDGVCMKVLREISPSISSAKISDHSEESVKFASALEQGNRMKDNGSTYQPRTSCKSQRERKSSIKGALEHRDQQRRLGDHESRSLCPRSEVHKAGSQKLPHSTDSIQQNNHQQEHTSDSMTDIAGRDTVQQQNEDQSSLVTHKNDTFQATPRTTAVRIGTLGKSDHQKSTLPEGCYENELSITCPMKDGTGAVAQDDTQNKNKFVNQKSSGIAHACDIHLTGSAKEGENGEFHLVVNTENIDTLFPSPKSDHSGTTMKVLSVNCNVLKGFSGASNGHSTYMKGVVHPEKCAENSSMPSNAAERVAEKRIASPEANVNVSTSVIPEVPTLCLKVTGSVNDQLPISHLPRILHHGQNKPDNHSVEMSSVSEPSHGQALLCKKSIQDSSSQSQIFRIPASVMKQTEVAVKDKPTSESDSVVRADCSKASCSLPHSTEDLNQTPLCTTLQANISNREETTSAVVSLRPTVGSDQLQPEPFLPKSKSTNDKIQHGIDVPVSLALPRIRVRDPESLGITGCKKSFFKDMDTKLCELTEVTYILLQDIARFYHRHRTLCHLTGTLKDTETALANAEYATYHQIDKAKTFLDLYKYVERSFSDKTKDILIKRLSELNSGYTYTSEKLEMCQKFCIVVLRNSQMNVEKLGSTSRQDTMVSVPLLQQISQQHPVGVPIPSNVASNTNNQLVSLLQARGQLQPSSEANITSEQNVSGSIQNVVPIAAVICTSSSKERMTHTVGSATNATATDIRTRETRSNLNLQHAKPVNIPQQQLPNYPVHTQNLQGRQLMYSNTISYIPQPVHEIGRTTTFAQGQMLNNPPETGTVHRVPLHSYGVKHITPFVAPNVVSHRNRSVVPGFTGSVPASGSSYSLQNPLSRTHAPNLQVVPPYTPNNVYDQNQGTQQRMLAYYLSKDAGSSRALYPSNQHTQQDMFLRTMNNNSALYKSASNYVSQPYPRNEAMQQDALCQATSNALQNMSTLNPSSRLYPGNEASKQRTFSESASYPSSVLEQNVSSHYMNSIAVQSSAPNSSGRPYVPNQVINQGMFSHQLSNDFPSSTVTGGAGNVSLLELSASGKGPMREGQGYVHPKGNNFYRQRSLPPPCIALSLSSTQMAPHAQKRVSFQEHRAPAVQGNTGSYNGGPSGCPQQHQTLPVTAELLRRLCGTTQHAPANNGSFYGGNAQNGSCGNNTVNSRFSDKENNQSRSTVISAVGNTLSDSRNTSCIAASNVHDSREKHPEPASNSFWERGNNHYLSASTVGSNSLFVGRENQSGPVPNRTASNSLSGAESNSSVSLTNSLSDRRNNQNRSLPNRAAGNSICDMESNQTGSIPVITSNRLSDKGNSWCGPLLPVNIPPSTTYQARLADVHQQSNEPTQKSVSEIGHQNVNNITQNHLLGAASVSPAENHNVNDKNGTFELHAISEAAPREDLQYEINSNISVSPASPNSQIVLNGNQQSSLCRSQQRQLPSIVTAQPALSKNTPVTIQASGNPNCVPEATGISFTEHSAETLHMQDCEPLSTAHFTFGGTVNEPSEKPVPVQQSTNTTSRTESQQDTSSRATSQTYWRTSNSNSRNQPSSDEVVDSGNDVQLETESECLGSDVTSKQSEQQEITILTAEECMPMSNSERSRTSSLNTIPTHRVEGAGGSDNRRDADSEVQFVSSVT
jgi:hypothetical protein